jgi:hypothetical protein
MPEPFPNGLERINWAECFAHFCGGLPLTDVATLMNCSLEKLESRARSERWVTMKARMEAQAQGLVPVHPDDLAKRANLIQANREENYRAFSKLRDHAVELIDEIRATKGKGLSKRYFHNKGTVVEHVCDLSLQELNTLANYLQVIAQGTYAALGDSRAASGTKEDGGQPNAQTVPTIQIILPNVIARPRAERNVTPNESAIDV